MKVKDLKPQINTTAPRELLYCRHCHGEYSADSVDYFSIDPEHTLTCCGEPMSTVIKRVVYSVIGGRR